VRQKRRKKTPSFGWPKMASSLFFVLRAGHRVFFEEKEKKNKVQFKIQVHGSKNAYQKSTICKQSIRVFDGKL
jgi:hypothetical protein